MALGCLDAKYKSWKATAKGLPETDFSRYQRINRLVNNAISSRENIDYLVLPELSIPPRWFSRMAIKLAQNGSSLIAGVDYLHHPGRKNRVANQAWASLCTDYLGFPQAIIYRQDKTRLAQEEERNIWQLAGQRHKTMSPKRKNKPLIIHGDFHFAILICSELTNIKHRARLRGKVDAVFVPEWNFRLIIARYLMVPSSPFLMVLTFLHLGNINKGSLEEIERLHIIFSHVNKLRYIEMVISNKKSTYFH